jgi:dTDP-4-amino-4,6-dideoxygalactose transaminase
MSDKPFIPIAKPLMGEEEALATHKPILSGWVTQGPEVAAFEQEFAAMTGAAHACAVGNCTHALHLALLAVGVAPGDEVITVSHSFIATANAVRYCGAKPVFIDIQPETYNMDPILIERVISPRTQAILLVHQVGMPADLHSILTVAHQHNLPVVEDAACATGSEIFWNDAWEKIGRPHGDVACFSFHPRKVISTGDGGMLTTNNPKLDKKFRLLRQHGMSVPDTVRHKSNDVIFESYDELGFNFRMTDIQAAVGRVQLSRLPMILERRRELAERYHALLTDIPGLVLPFEPDWARSNWQSYIVRLPQGCDQRAVMQSMLDDGIATRRGIMNAHREPAYPAGTWSCGDETHACICAPGTCARLRESELAQAHAIVIPLYVQMTDADQDRVVASLRKAVEQCGRGD